MPLDGKQDNGKKEYLCRIAVMLAQRKSALDDIFGYTSVEFDSWFPFECRKT
jgi:hypothetical protein